MHVENFLSHIDFYPPNRSQTLTSLLDQTPLVIFNPLPYEITKRVEFFVDFKNNDEIINNPPEIFSILDPNLQSIPFHYKIVRMEPDRKNHDDATTFSFAFLAQIPAMGYATYWLCPSLNNVFEEYPLAPDLISSDLSLKMHL